MSAEPSVLQDGQSAPLLQEQVRGGDHVRGGEGAGGAPGRVQGLQCLRSELWGGGEQRARARDQERGLRVLHQRHGD